MSEYRVRFSLTIDVAVDVDAEDAEAAELAALSQVTAFAETIYSTEPRITAMSNTDGLEAYEIEETAAS